MTGKTKVQETDSAENKSGLTKMDFHNDILEIVHESPAMSMIFDA